MEVIEIFLVYILQHLKIMSIHLCIIMFCSLPISVSSVFLNRETMIHAPVTFFSLPPLLPLSSPFHSGAVSVNSRQTSFLLFRKPSYNPNHFSLFRHASFFPSSPSQIGISSANISLGHMIHGFGNGASRKWIAATEERTESTFQEGDDDVVVVVVVVMVGKEEVPKKGE